MLVRKKGKICLILHFLLKPKGVTLLATVIVKKTKLALKRVVKHVCLALLERIIPLSAWSVLQFMLTVISTL